jgi:hypothetical protein
MKSTLAQNALHSLWKGFLSAGGSYLTTMLPLPSQTKGPAAFFVGLIIWGALHGIGIAMQGASTNAAQPPATPAKGK